MTADTQSSGLITRITGADYIVVDGGVEVRCSIRGRFRLEKSPAEVLPVVGDNVVYERSEGGDTLGITGVIVSVQPRKSVFARATGPGGKKIKVFGANLDRVFLVHSCRNPSFNARLIDRMLVASECDGIEPVICINKIDLAGDIDRLSDEFEVYRKLNYTVLLCSAVEGTGVAEIRKLMTGKRSIMAGPSGTGKTSLLGAAQPGLDIRVGDVSEKTGKGKHTTSHFELHPLDGGGYLGDTPGIREFGIWGQSKQTLDETFRDFEPFYSSCRFSSCTHSHEPGCAVKDAVETGGISRQRYDSYLRILSELPDILE